jgi:integrase
MEGLKIPKAYITKGLYIYCNRCKKIITDKNGQSNIADNCKHFEDQVYKSVIYPPGVKTAKTKVLPTRDISEARKLHIEFEENVKKGLQATPEKLSIIKPIKPQSVKGCIGLYFAYLLQTADNSNLTQHQKQVERYVLNFARFLRNEGLNLDTLGINEIEPKYIKLFCNHLDKKYSSNTFNKYITLLTGFFNHLKYVEGYQIVNPFHMVKHKPTFFTPKSFPINQLRPFLESITEDKGIKVYTEKVRKTLYKPYLNEIFLLSLYTGRRREGLVTMKFNEITPDEEGKPKFITTDDIKFNKRYKLTHNGDKKKVIIPVSLELVELLYSLGYEEYKGSDKYIVATASDEKRDTIMNIASKAFSHYWKQYSKEKGIDFNTLRKAYITEMHIKFGSIAKIITHGASNDVINKHYMDVMRIVAEINGQYLYKTLENPTPVSYSK